MNPYRWSSETVSKSKRAFESAIVLERTQKRYAKLSKIRSGSWRRFSTTDWRPRCAGRQGPHAGQRGDDEESALAASRRGNTGEARREFAKASASPRLWISRA